MERIARLANSVKGKASLESTDGSLTSDPQCFYKYIAPETVEPFGNPGVFFHFLTPNSFRAGVVLADSGNLGALG